MHRAIRGAFRPRSWQAYLRLFPLVAVPVTLALLAGDLTSFTGLPVGGPPPAASVPQSAPPAESSEVYPPPVEQPPADVIQESFVERAPALILPGDDATDGAEPMRLIPYEVQPGDTVRSIAAKFNIPPETIITVNDLANPDFIQPGQKLEIMPVPGLAYRVKAGDTLAAIVDRYRADIWEVIRANALKPPYIIAPGQRLLVPGGKLPELMDLLGLGRTGDGRQPVAPAVPAPAPAPTPRPRTASTREDQFIAMVAPAAQLSQKETGIPASVTIAQAILESYWGTSTLARQANNYFGIKAKERPGTAGVIWLNVWEHIGGQDVTVREPFRAYNNMAESFIDHGRFFLTNSIYATALKYVNDPREFARQIHRAGYATDPKYSDKLIALMDKYNLYQFDR